MSNQESNLADPNFPPMGPLAQEQAIVAMSIRSLEAERTLGEQLAFEQGRVVAHMEIIEGRSRTERIARDSLGLAIFLSASALSPLLSVKKMLLGGGNK